MDKQKEKLSHEKKIVKRGRILILFLSRLNVEKTWDGYIY